MRCDLLPASDVGDKLDRFCAEPVAVQFRKQLKTPMDVGFRGDAIKPSIVTMLNEVPAHLSVDFEVAQLKRQFRRQQQPPAIIDKAFLGWGVASIDDTLTSQ